MNQAQLNKYCDEVLRILYKNANGDPLLFGVGEFRSEEKLADDLFVKIKLSEEDTKTIIQTLEGVYHYIETDTKEKTSYYDLDKKENINSAVFAIKLTEAGSYFVQTSSFTKEARWKNFNRWVPNIPNIVALSAVLISVMACIISYSDSKQKKKELIKQKEEIQQQMKESESKILFRVDSLFNSNSQKH